MISLEGKIMEVADKQLMKQISEAMLAATVSAEEVARASKEIALLLHSTEYNPNSLIR